MSLTAAYFNSNAPSPGQNVFRFSDEATAYYLPGTAGWISTFGGRPVAPWKPLTEASAASFGVRTKQFGFTIAWPENRVIVVETCTNLTQPVWSLLQANTLATSSEFRDPLWKDHPVRFYRIRSL